MLVDGLARRAFTAIGCRLLECPGNRGTLFVLANALSIGFWVHAARIEAAPALVDACSEWGCCDREWHGEIERFERAAQWIRCDLDRTGDELVMLDAVLDSRSDCEVEDAMQEVLALMADACAGVSDEPELHRRWDSRLVVEGDIAVGAAQRGPEWSRTRHTEVQWRCWFGWSVRWQGGVR